MPAEFKAADGSWTGVIGRSRNFMINTNLVQQARRLADRTMFFWNGEIIEIGTTAQVFSEQPKDRRTYDYVNGIFG